MLSDHAAPIVLRINDHVRAIGRLLARWPLRWFVPARVSWHLEQIGICTHALTYQRNEEGAERS